MWLANRCPNFLCPWRYLCNYPVPLWMYLFSLLMTSSQVSLGGDESAATPHGSPLRHLSLRWASRAPSALHSETSVVHVDRTVPDWSECTLLSSPCPCGSSKNASSPLLAPPPLQPLGSLSVHPSRSPLVGCADHPPSEPRRGVLLSLSVSRSRPLSLSLSPVLSPGRFSQNVVFSSVRERYSYNKGLALGRAYRGNLVLTSQPAGGVVCPWKVARWSDLAKFVLCLFVLCVDPVEVAEDAVLASFVRSAFCAKWFICGFYRRLPTGSLRHGSCLRNRPWEHTLRLPAANCKPLF